MAIAVRTISTPARNTAHVCGGAANYTITSTTAGDLLIAYIAYFQAEARTVTGITGGGTWTSAVAQSVDANSHQELWVAHNVSAGVTALSVTLNGSGLDTNAVVQVTCIHCSGGATSSAVDVTPTPTTGTSNAPSITSGTLAQADEIIVSGNTHTGADLTTMTEDTGDGFTEANQNLDNDFGQTFELQYKVVAATTSLVVGASYNASRQWGAILASFKGAGGGGGIRIPVVYHQRQRNFG